MNTEFQTIRDNHFIISDTHFFHNNIVKYSQRPGFDPRGKAHDFDLHNKIMVANWQKVIKPTDVVLHLGDLAFFPQAYQQRQDAKDLLRSLPGRKYLILGNHDESKPATYEDLGFTVIEPFSMNQDDFEVFFDHYPKKDTRPGMVSIHGHTHNNVVHGVNKHHLNVCVELRSFTPQPLKLMVDTAIFSASKTDFSRDFGVVRKRKRDKL